MGFKRVKYVFSPSYSLQIESDNEFINELERIAKEAGFLKMMNFLDENKKKFKRLKQWHIDDIAIDRIVDIQDEFQQHCEEYIKDLEKVG